MSDSFSVVTTVHAQSYQSQIKRCLESCMQNDIYNPSEIIVVGDGIDKFNLDMLSETTRSRVVFIPHKKVGLAGCLNAGVEASKTPIIARIDTDDYNIPGRFDIQLPYFVKNKLIICGGFIEALDLASGKRSIRKVPLSNASIRLLLWWSPFYHPTVMFSKEAFLSAGAYNEKLLRRQDYDLWYRLVKKGVCRNQPNVLVVYSYDSTKQRTLSSILSQVKTGTIGAFKNGYYWATPLPSLLVLKWIYKWIRRKLS